MRFARVVVESVNNGTRELTRSQVRKVVSETESTVTLTFAENSRSAGTFTTAKENVELFDASPESIDYPAS